MAVCFSAAAAWALASRARTHSAAVSAALLRALAAAPPRAADVDAVLARYLGAAAALAPSLAPGEGKLSALQAQLERLKDAARASSEDLLGRGARLDSLVARSDALAVRSQDLRTAAKDTRAGAAQLAAQRRGGGACGGGAAPALLLALFGSVGLAYLILRAG